VLAFFTLLPGWKKARMQMITKTDKTQPMDGPLRVAGHLRHASEECLKLEEERKNGTGYALSDAT
jgi:hypothetical protein